MPVPLLVLMLQSAYRVVFERESLRLAGLLGVVPALGAFLGSLLAVHGFGMDPGMSGDTVENPAALGGIFVGTALGFLGSLFVIAPFAVKAAGDLLARKLGCPPSVTPREATKRAWRILAQAAVVTAGLGAFNVAVGIMMPAGPAIFFVALLLLAVGIYVMLGLVLGAAQIFYGPSADLRLSFAMMKGERVKILAFLVAASIPFVFVANVIGSLADAQPEGDWLLVAAVSLLGGFVNGLSSAPQLVGLVQAYFAKSGETPPTIVDTPEA
ncbi:MAG: hypothetical protein PHS60_08320 [Zavarzinia sp.]|nr:hypothetical protein [Zavarzinia sp.]